MGVCVTPETSERNFEMTEQADLNVVELATELTIAWLGNQHNRTSADEVPGFLKSMHATLVQLEKSEADGGSDSDAEAANTQQYQPAVTARKSLSSKEHIISMIDGKPYKTLRRHLSTNGLTPEEYRSRYNLKPDYPMVAEAYSEQRRAMAKKIGLGRKPVAGKSAATKRTTTTKPDS